MSQLCKILPIALTIVLTYGWLSNERAFSQPTEVPPRADVRDATQATANEDVETSIERDDVDAAIERGIHFLVSHQREDGAITER
ncbi:MAG: hypothetical protein ABI557_12135, partial [Aureliella sp.]